MASNFPMATADYNVTLQDVSNHSHISKSQLLRHLSTHSSSTSGSSKRISARIMKQNSAGNSPHNVQRRKTTANTARPHPRPSQSSPYQTAEQCLNNYYNARQALLVERPMSWHPGSETISASTQVRTSEPVLGNTITGLQNLAVSGQPVPSVQQSIENAFAMGYGIPIGKPLTVDEHSPSAGYGDYQPALESTYRPNPSYSSEPIYNPYWYNTFQQYQLSSMPQTATQDMYTPTNYQVPQWPEAQTIFANDYQVPQAPVDLWSSNPGQDLNARPAPQISKRANKELSGIGLYDDKIPDSTPCIGNDPNRDSMGKGLKLEETWQPPKDDVENDDDDDDDEGSCSTDEGEEIEEDPPILASAVQNAQTAFYPPFGDLSNKSFFFSNDDDPYTAEEQYPNYVTFGQAQSKPQNPVTDNFLWC